MDPTLNIISKPAVFLAQGLLNKKEDDAENVISSIWTVPPTISDAFALPLGTRLTMLANFGSGVKSGVMICILQLVISVIYFTRYMDNVDSICNSYGFCDQKVPRLMQAMFALTLGEIIVDSYFGIFYIVETQQIQKLVMWVASHSNLQPKEAYNVLDVMLWVIAAFIISILAICYVLNSIIVYYTPDDWWVFVFHLVNCYNTWCTFFLSAVWVWENWMLNRVGDFYVQKRLEGDFGSDGVVAGIRCHELLQKMSEVSGTWAINHGFRVFFAFFDITLYLSWYIVTLNKIEAENKLVEKCVPAMNVLVLVLAIAFYLIVVLTLVAPGFVTSKFFSSLQLKVSKMATWVTHDFMRPRMPSEVELEDSKQGIESRKDSHKKKRSIDVHHIDSQQQAGLFHQTCTMFMVRFGFVKDSGGMHFAGLPIGVGQALTVIMVSAYIQYDIIRIIASE
eukprot:jgi/Bigna1/80247/fgenesh1_pg.69_\